MISMKSASWAEQHLKMAVLAESIDEDGQQGGVQLLRIVQRHDTPGAALQKRRQLLLHSARCIRAGMRCLPSLQDIAPWSQAYYSLHQSIAAMPSIDAFQCPKVAQSARSTLPIGRSGCGLPGNNAAQLWCAFVMGSEAAVHTLNARKQPRQPAGRAF